MATINIVLVEPEIPQNTGNIARTCAATGCALHLVRPLGFTIDDRKLKRAGLDYWDKLDITYYDHLEAFLEAHKEESDRFYFFTTKGQQCYADVSYPQDQVFLIFGKETAGLPESLLCDYPSQCVRLPMRESLRSLNLSNTVAVAVYEVLRQGGFSGLQTAGQLHHLSWKIPPRE